MRTIVVVLLIALNGCASLKVNVSVLDPMVIEGETDRLFLRDALPKVLAMRSADVKAKYQTLENEHFQAYVQLGEALNKECAIAERAAQLFSLCPSTLQADFNQFVRPHYAEAVPLIEAQREEVVKVSGQLKTASESEKPVLEPQLLASLREYDFRVRHFVAFVNADISGTPNNYQTGSFNDVRRVLSTIAAPVPTGAVAAAQRATAATLAELLKAHGLSEDPFAYVVASSEKARWAPHYNLTKAAGLLGASDIAIRMIELDNFTIKGIAFDPADVAQMASKVVSQSLMLAAKINGVSVDSPGSSEPGDAIAKAGMEVTTLEDSLTRQEASLVDQRAALLDIAAAIARERVALKADGERAAAIEAIQAVYDAHAPRLTAGGN
jgi:hypothetical protein